MTRVSASLTDVQEKTRPVSRPHDPAEHEADRAAAVVLGGGSAAGWSFASVPLCSRAPVGGGTSGVPVQRRAEERGGADATHANVEGAIAGPGRPLDAATRAWMGDRFGYDFSGVRVHDDGRANAAATGLGAAAFTLGRDIVFGAGRFDPASPSGGHLLAHELAHVVQQERSPAAASVVQRYTAYSAAEQSAGTARGWAHPAGGPIRISDDGQMAVEDNGWGEGRNKRAWTTPALVASANSVLTAQGSRANLRAKPGSPSISGTSPDSGTASTLVEIEPFKPSGGEFNLASDCGDACRQVMGSGGRDVAQLSRPPDPGSTGLGGGIAGGILGGLVGGAAGAALGSLAGPVGAVIGGIIGAIAGAYGGYRAGRALGRRDPQPAREEYLTPRDYHGGDPTTPEEWTEELLRRDLGGGSREGAYEQYAKLSPAERDEFDREHGINKYARPRVGQGLTISTEKDMPGFSTGGARVWNFHYAATVLTSGDDFVTLESARWWAPTAWIFYLYGPARKGQSFSEEQAATRTHGTHHMTYVVQSEGMLDVRTIGATTLRRPGGNIALPAGTALRIIQRRTGTGGNPEYLVRVVSGPNAGETGLVAASEVR